MGGFDSITGQWVDALPGDIIQIAATLIPAARILTLNTPLILVPPPGPGKVAIPLFTFARLYFNGTAYTAVNAIFRIQYTGTTQGLTAGVATTLVLAAANTSAYSVQNASGSVLDAAMVNNSIEIVNPGAQAATGNSPILVVTPYIILPI